MITWSIYENYSEGECKHNSVTFDTSVYLGDDGKWVAVVRAIVRGSLRDDPRVPAPFPFSDAASARDWCERVAVALLPLLAESER